jgi:hypothetical protein
VSADLSRRAEVAIVFLYTLGVAGIVFMALRC